MKKVIATTSLLLGVIFLSGCGQKQNNQMQNLVMNKIVANFTCGSQVKDASGITYGTVLAEDGRCWLDRNLGATKVATSHADEASFGWYFQWGRNADGHQIPTSETTKTLSSSDNPGHAKFIVSQNPYDWRSLHNDNLWQGVDGVNNPCPRGFQLPTWSEWGVLVSAANIKDYATAFKSSLKLPAAGQRNFSDGSIYHSNKNEIGHYWSSTFYSTNAQDLMFSDYGKITTDGIAAVPRTSGFPVRCIMAQPEESQKALNTNTHSATEYGDEIRINAYDTYIPNLPAFVRDALNQSLYANVRTNLKSSNFNVGDANIRDGSVKYEFDEIKTHSGSFIVDMQSIKQSYEMSYKWSQDKNKNILGVYTATKCLPSSKLLFGDFDCKDYLTDSTNETKPNPILDYLPYSTFNYSITANDDSNKIGLNVDIFLYSADTRDGGKEESIKKYKSEVIDWIKLKKLNPDDYSINYNIN